MGQLLKAAEDLLNFVNLFFFPILDFCLPKTQKQEEST